MGTPRLIVMPKAGRRQRHDRPAIQPPTMMPKGELQELQRKTETPQRTAIRKGGRAEPRDKEIIMSSMHTIELDCPQCRKKSPFTIHDSINVSLDPEDKEKVLDRSLFIFQCPHCGFESCVQYGSLYHDMTNKYMISVCGDEETARNSPIPDIGDTIHGKKLSMLNDGYRFRTVVHFDGLAEKISIFDAELDDFAVEFVKAVILKQANEVTRLYFTQIDESSIYFYAIFPDEEKNTGLSISRDVYDEAVKMLGEKSRKSKEQFITPVIAATLCIQGRTSELER
jgi:hypothetical protein